jgi:hypothetical protein
MYLLESSLAFTNSTPQVMKSVADYGRSLMTKMNRSDEVHTNLPSIAKHHSFFGPFTAYSLSSGSVYRTLNANLRK